MTIATSREQRRQLARDNAKLPTVLTEVPNSTWPNYIPDGLRKVYRSRDFLVQEFIDNGHTRLSVARSAVDVSTGRWKEGISWDELQRLKREAGYGNFDAVEIYPKDRDVVNVANMRHLWILETPLPFAWRKK